MIPPHNMDIMITYPYLEYGQRLDEATSDLLIFGHPVFRFFNQTSFLLKPDLNSKWDYELVDMYPGSYTSLKKDLGKYKEYLSSGHLCLTSQWFKHNPNSPISQGYEIVRDNSLSLAIDIYECLMNNDGQIT